MSTAAGMAAALSWRELATPASGLRNEIPYSPTSQRMAGFSQVKLTSVRDGFVVDSALEGAGFEPSVPHKTPGVRVASGVVRADDVSPLAGITHRQRKPVLVVSRGTDGSNPSPSSEESANFRFRRSGNRIPTFTVILQRNPNAARLATDYNMSVKSLRNRRH
jgi:hypothetical protein